MFVLRFASGPGDAVLRSGAGATAAVVALAAAPLVRPSPQRRAISLYTAYDAFHYKGSTSPPLECFLNDGAPSPKIVGMLGSKI